MKKLLLILSLVALPLNALADFKDYYFLNSLRKKTDQINLSHFFRGILSSTGPSLPNPFVSVETEFFDQRLNHNDPSDKRTFRQRYFVSSSYAQGPDSPVLYYVCGESACDSPFWGAISLHAKELKAHLIALEHRYYGKSQPFPSLESRNLTYLSVENALQDLAYFQDYAVEKFNLKGKFISVGGSYPGSLSAYYRLSYPNLVAGALASSAPVEARENFEEYDLHVSTVVGPVCGKAIKQVVEEIESNSENAEKLAKYKRFFFASKIREKDDFLYFVADIAAAAVQYGMKDDFCQQLINASYPLESYGEFAKKILDTFGVDAVGFSVQAAENLDPTAGDSGMRQWFYQSCTQFGFWQTAYHDKDISVRSSRIDLDYHRRLCKRFFNLDTPADTAAINQKYLEPLADPSRSSNVFFTNGSQDPWIKLSLALENNNTNNSNHDYYTIKKAAHCEDLGFGSAADTANARSGFIRHAKEWLK